jgi:opacity protein-like surface antigen
LHAFGSDTLVDGSGTNVTIPVDATVGVRWRDTLVTVGWGVSPTRSAQNGMAGDFQVPFWGGARASVTTVLRQRLLLDASVLVLENGAAAGGDATLYLERRLGIVAAIKGGHQAHNTDSLTSTFTSTLDYVGFGAGVIVWPTAHVFADLRYDFEWDKHGIGVGDSSAASVLYDNTVRVGIGFRH